MYREYYGLSDLPFELTPNPRFLFLAPPYREALSTLKYGIQSGKPLTLLIGDAGTGKTTLIRSALSRLKTEHEDAHFCLISNPTLSRREFVEILANGFGLSAEAKASKAAMLLELAAALSARRAAGCYSALVVDEAQCLSDELIEEIRLIGNIETDDERLLPVILAGQPELSERLNRPLLRQVKQRVALRCTLRALDLHETAAYVAGRIRTAGGDSAKVFTREAVTLIHERSGGVPRLISVICDNALVSGFALDSKPVTRAIVAEVCTDLQLEPPEAPAGAAPAVASVNLPQTTSGAEEDEAFHDEQPARWGRRFRFF